MNKTMNEMAAQAKELAEKHGTVAVVGRLWHSKRRSSLCIRFNAITAAVMEDGSRWEPLEVVA